MAQARQHREPRKMRRNPKIRLIGFLLGFLVGVVIVAALWELAIQWRHRVGFIYRPWWLRALLVATAMFGTFGGCVGVRIVRGLGSRRFGIAPAAGLRPQIVPAGRRVLRLFVAWSATAVLAVMCCRFLWPFLVDESDCGLLYCTDPKVRVDAIARLRERRSLRAVRDLARATGQSVHLEFRGLAGPGAGCAIEFNPVPVRLAAIAALGDLGPAARDAIPALERAAEDFRPEVRDAALAAMSKIRERGYARERRNAE